MTTNLDVPGTQLRVRLPGLDGWRGLAMLLMVTDHLWLVAGGPHWFRETVTRLAMPAFFLLAGHLHTRLRWRHLGIALLGVLLTVLVPWIDSPNVLTLWAIGCLALTLARWGELPAWLLIAVALTLAANGMVDTVGHYDQAALVGLMALGTLLPASAFTTIGDRAPAWVAALGRRPVMFYAGHLLALQGLLIFAAH